MIDYASCREMIEAAIGRGPHVHVISEDAWSKDMLATLNEISKGVAVDLSRELGKPTWDFTAAGPQGQPRLVTGGPFEGDPHPRLLGLALALLHWYAWQLPTHQNISAEEVQRLLNDALKQGAETAAREAARRGTKE